MEVNFPADIYISNSDADYQLENVLSVSRYHLPFITATHHSRSPWSGKSQDSQSQLSLLSGLPAEALRISWNVAWHDGIEEAITRKNSSSEQYDMTEDCRSCTNL